MRNLLLLLGWWWVYPKWKYLWHWWHEYSGKCLWGIIWICSYHGAHRRSCLLAQQSLYSSTTILHKHSSGTIETFCSENIIYTIVNCKEGLCLLFNTWPEICYKISSYAFSLTGLLLTCWTCIVCVIFRARRAFAKSRKVNLKIIFASQLWNKSKI